MQKRRHSSASIASSISYNPTITSPTQSLFGSVPWIPSISKLFSDRVEVYSDVIVSRLGIMTAIVKVVAKSVSEWARLVEFSTEGFQQLQVDVELARVKFAKFIGENE